MLWLFRKENKANYIQHNQVPVFTPLHVSPRVGNSQALKLLEKHTKVDVHDFNKLYVSKFTIDGIET